MDIQHLNIKLFAAQPEAINADDFIVIFNNWIQARANDELLIDVADYRHVHAGPGILLIGHEAHYSLDHAQKRWGLLYNRKAQVEGTTQAKLAQAVRAALSAARRLERENGVAFSGREIQVVINDRLVAPNTPQTLAALEPDLRAFFDRAYGEVAYSLDHAPDPRERFTVTVRASAEVSLQTLLENLAVEAVNA